MSNQVTLRERILLAVKKRFKYAAHVSGMRNKDKLTYYSTKGKLRDLYGQSQTKSVRKMRRTKLSVPDEQGESAVTV